MDNNGVPDFAFTVVHCEWSCFWGAGGGGGSRHVTVRCAEKFFCSRWSPSWTLASSITALYGSRSCDLCHQFVKPIMFRSYSTQSSHLIAGVPNRRVPSGLWHVSLLLRSLTFHLHDVSASSTFRLWSSLLFLGYYKAIPLQALTGPEG
jgi:hypothetical protein